MIHPFNINKRGKLEERTLFYGVSAFGHIWVKDIVITIFEYYPSNSFAEAVEFDDVLGVK